MKGFCQKKDIAFEEISSPTLKMSSIRVIFNLATHLNFVIEQLYVKTVFLHSDLEVEDIHEATRRIQS